MSVISLQASYNDSKYLGSSSSASKLANTAKVLVNSSNVEFTELRSDDYLTDSKVKSLLSTLLVYSCKYTGEGNLTFLESNKAVKSGIRMSNLSPTSKNNLESAYTRYIFSSA